MDVSLNLICTTTFKRKLFYDNNFYDSGAYPNYRNGKDTPRRWKYKYATETKDIVVKVSFNESTSSRFVLEFI